MNTLLFHPLYANPCSFIKAVKNSESFFQTNLKLIHFKDIVETHPGLEFLRDAPDFHSRYIHTVSSVIISHLS